jgi:plastocyanin
MQSTSRRHSVRNRRLLACLSLASAILLASCGGSRAAAGTTHTIDIDGTAFVPPEMTVHVGDTVVWKNKDPFPHTATSKSAGFDSQDIDEGGSWSYKATKAGDFEYDCTLHDNMKGVLHVK